MFADVLAAAAQTFSPPFRSTLWKTLGLTILLLAFASIGLDRLALAIVPAHAPWIRIPLSILTGAGLLFGAAYLVAPISALIGGFWADDLAALVEWEIDPRKVGQALAPGLAIRVGLRFAGLAVVVNAAALLLLFFPPFNVVAFLGANAYLLGRVYFEFAALRHRAPPQTIALYRRHALGISLYGLWIAVFMSIPLVNLVTPLFAVALMTRVYARLDAQD